METIAVLVVVGASVAYLARTFKKNIKSEQPKCTGCSCKDKSACHSDIN